MRPAIAAVLSFQFIGNRNSPNLPARRRKSATIHGSPGWDGTGRAGEGGCEYQKNICRGTCNYAFLAGTPFRLGFFTASPKFHGVVRDSFHGVSSPPYARYIYSNGATICSTYTTIKFLGVAEGRERRGRTRGSDKFRTPRVRLRKKKKKQQQQPNVLVSYSRVCDGRVPTEHAQAHSANNR